MNVSRAQTHQRFGLWSPKDCFCCITVFLSVSGIKANWGRKHFVHKIGHFVSHIFYDSCDILSSFFILLDLFFAFLSKNRSGVEFETCHWHKLEKVFCRGTNSLEWSHFGKVFKSTWQFWNLFQNQFQMYFCQMSIFSHSFHSFLLK